MAYYHQSIPGKPPALAPESPVPSCQSASQGSMSSPGGSMNSGGFTDHSSPSSPNASSSEPQWPLTPVLYNEGEPRTIMVVQELSDGQGEVEQFKTATDTARQHGANRRALALLEAHAGKGESIKEFKSTVDTAREHGANMKAIALLEATSGKKVSAVAKATSVSQTQSKPSLMAHQAASIKYEQRLKQKAEIRAKLKRDMEKPAPTTATPRGLEHLAETTRKPKERTAEDVRDPETVPGMKCKLDIEREIFARKKALRLMKYGGIMKFGHIS